MEDAGCNQANLVNDIVSHMSGLPFTYPTWGCQEPIYTLIPNPAPKIAPIVQPSLAANVAIDAASNILTEILITMQYMQQLMVQIQTNQSVGVGQTIDQNTYHPPTFQAETEPRQGQPHKPLPDFSTKYFWTHGNCAHERAACNNKSLNHKDTVTLCNKLNGITYGYTWQGESKKLMFSNIDNKINFIRRTINFFIPTTFTYHN